MKSERSVAWIKIKQCEECAVVRQVLMADRSGGRVDGGRSVVSYGRVE